MFEDMKRVKAWIHLEGRRARAGPRRVREARGEVPSFALYDVSVAVSRLVLNTGQGSTSWPAFAINLVRLYNSHPSGAMHADERLESVMGNGGIEDCGKAQNCVELSEGDSAR